MEKGEGYHVHFGKEKIYFYIIYSLSLIHVSSISNFKHIVHLPGSKIWGYGVFSPDQDPPFFFILGTLNVSKKLGGHSRAVALMLQVPSKAEF